ncbi:MAG: xanthine dehydrogenase family protein molybdopterin-binding subunit [Promethearchaeota archaeon]
MNEKAFKGKVVGQNVEKVDGMKLALGKPAYVADMHLPGMLYAKILVSPHAHARIKDIDISEAEKIPGVHSVLCYKNVPRILHTTAGQGYPEPSPYDNVFFDNKVRFVGDKVAVVAAETPLIAQKAIRNIKVEYEVLPTVLDLTKAMAEGAPVIHDEPEAKYLFPTPYEPNRNLVAHVDIDIGDVDKALEASDYKVDRTYQTQYAQHCPLEPHVCLSWLDEDNRLVIRSSTQVPFHARRIAAKVLDIPVKRVRVIKPRIGGGFGTKQEVLLEYICGALTLRTKRPVLLEYTRKEEFISGRTRHSMQVRMRIGSTKEGKITALDMKVLSNTGAYGTHGLTVMSNCGSKVLPLYLTENVRFWGDTVYTNLPVAGAYRGYGATQAVFACESAIDELAEQIGMDPLELRQKNHIKSGDSSPVFKKLGEGREGVEQQIGSCGLGRCIELGAKEIGWERRQSFPKEGPIRKGIGMAILMQGSSIPEIDMGAAYAKMNDDGSFNLLMGATDLGTGSDTVLSQIFAESVDVSIDKVIPYSSDTDRTPFDVGAYASSTTYLSGMAVQKCGEKIKKQILKVGAEMLETSLDQLETNFGIVKTRDGSKQVTYNEIALYALYSKNQFQIQATASHITHQSPPPFAAHFTEIEVDIETGKVVVVKYVAAVDCGTAIHPRLAEGQTEGSLLNGISFALTEEFIFNEKGGVLNPSFGHYKIYSTADLPEIKTILVPTYEETGPYGAKSVSEISINGPQPAIANAIYNAVGIRLKNPPFTPEKVFRALQEKKD